MEYVEEKRAMEIDAVIGRVAKFITKEDFDNKLNLKATELMYICQKMLLYSFAVMEQDGFSEREIATVFAAGQQHVENKRLKTVFKPYDLKILDRKGLRIADE